MKLPFRAIRVERQFSGEQANRPGIKLDGLDYFPRYIDLGCASVNM